MQAKKPVYPDFVRQIPKQFSWVDHRLVRDCHLDGCTFESATLYLFLVTVADEKGLSYYSDGAICRRLTMEENCLTRSRQNLVTRRLIAYKNPIYQVLPIPAFPLKETEKDNLMGPIAISEILRKMAGGKHD